MKFVKFKGNYIIIPSIIIYAFFVNWISANLGVMPIDTFGFFDTGFNILKNKLPIRDFWIFTGIIVDYFQALFFWLFGETWKSYVFHACILNIIVSLTFYFFLQELKLNKIYSFFYVISFATLCYPVSGTPFAYLHSYIFSLISIFLICILLKKNNPVMWCFLPVLFFLAFFSMQTPSVYIILILSFFSFYHFFSKKDYKSLKYFILSCIGCIFFLFFYLFLSKTPLENFILQYFLFPISLGSERILNDPTAYVSLKDKISFKGLVLDFKFVHIFLFSIVGLTIKQFYTQNQNKLSIYNLIIILSSFAFLFSQLVTANQIYIFSLIPILSSVLHCNIEKMKFSKYLKVLIIILVCFVTTKYHLRYNIERKFLDLEKINKKEIQNAGILDSKMNNLKWITPYHEPKEELLFLKNSIDYLKKDKRRKTLITHYHFISTLLDEDLNILNRWYLFGNDTHPTETHKYFQFYQNMVNKNIDDNEVQVIYLLSQKDEIPFDNIKNYFTEKCFKNKIIVENRFSSHEIIKCKK